MTLPEFVEKFDKPGTIVLLLGKRKVLPQDEIILQKFSSLLARSTKNIVFRSGNAGGSDELFAKGVASIDPDRMEVVTPYTGHRKKYSEQFRNVSLDQIDLVAEPEIISYSKKDNSNKNLIDRYEKGHRDKFAMKGAYLLRDTLMVVGAKSLNVPRASFTFFYDDMKDPKSGGTGHTMKVCDSLGIPYSDQSVWKEWINSH